MRGKGKFRREASEEADGRGEPADRQSTSSVSIHLSTGLSINIH